MRLPWRREAAREGLLVASRDDPPAFRAFYDAYTADIMVFFLRRTVDRDLSFELTAETFAIAFERRAQYRGGSTAEEQAWLYAIARSRLTRFLRRSRVERAAVQRLGVEVPALEDDLEMRALEDRAALPALRDRLSHALASLPESQAEAIRQRIVHERPYAEIAGEAGVSEDVVRAWVSRGLRALRRQLADLEQEGSWKTTP